MKAVGRFDCQIYISGHGAMQVAMPVLSSPRREARLQSISFESLADPILGHLLVAFDKLPEELILTR